MVELLKTGGDVDKVKEFLGRLVAASRPDADADAKALPSGEGGEAPKAGTLGKVPGLKSEL
jgi:hypothetical protein